MSKTREPKTVRVRNIHRTSRVNGIAPGREGLVSEATAKLYPMYFERVVDAPTEEPSASVAPPVDDVIETPTPKPKREKKSKG